MKYILALDQGTTSSRAIVYDENLKILSVGQHEFKQHFPRADWVEHDLEEIWDSMKLSVRDALAQVNAPGFDAKKIVAIGVTNQRETFGLWRRSNSKPVHKAIVWQCRRSSAICEKLKKTASGKKLMKITGLKIDPYFSGTKLKWLLDSSKEIKQEALKGELAFGTIDSFLVWRLTSGRSHVTETSNASRTMLLDLKSLSWSDFALKSLGVPRAILPEIKSSNALFGKTEGLDFLPDGIPICGILGDQQAALFGQACFRAGESKVTYGTGAFLLLNTDKNIKHSKNGLSSVGWTLGNRTSYVLEGSVFTAGAAVQWLRDGLGIIQKSSEVEALASSVPDSDGVFFVAALSGLGSPYWAPQARGMIGGLTRRSTKAHIARATLEGIAHAVADQFEALIKDGGARLKSLRCDGGAARNGILLQTQADYLQVKVQRPVDIESTARGAASIAALGVGLVKNLDELASKNPISFEARPQVPAKKARELRTQWKKRVELLL